MGEAPLPITVVVPVRNAEAFLHDCLDSILANNPAEVIVVDGCSTDRTLPMLEHYPQVRVLSDEGRGLPYARMLGAKSARCATLALIDVDILMPLGSLAALYDEYVRGSYVALQAGLVPGCIGDGYWGRALAEHQRIGRSRHWLGVCATLVSRTDLIAWGLDSRFRSGEDIELRHRLARAGARTGVSEQVLMHHRFKDGFADARAQWRDDGQGLARMVRTNGWRDARLVALPAAAAARGMALTCWRSPSLLPYWFSFLIFNYVAMMGTLASRDDREGVAEPALSLSANSAALAAARVAPMCLGLASWMVAATAFDPSGVGLAAAAVAAAALVSHLTLAGIGPAVVLLLPLQRDGGVRLALAGFWLVAMASLAVAVTMLVGALAFSRQLRDAVSSPATGTLFVVLACGFSMAFFLDHVAVGRQRADRALVRSVAQSSCFLAITLVCSLTVGPENGLHVILAGTTAGAVLSIVVGLAQLHGKRVSMAARPAIPVRAVMAELLRLSGANYFLTVAQRAPMYLLPLVVTEQLSAEANASWYAVWMMFMAMWFVPNSLGYGLQARMSEDLDAATDQGSTRAGVRRAMRTGLSLEVPLMAVVLLGAPVALGLLGPTYSAALPVLWTLAPAGLLAIPTETWMAVSRVHRKFLPATTVHALAGSAAVLGAILVADLGLLAIALVWTGSQLFVAACALVGLRSIEAPVREGGRRPVSSPSALVDRAGARM